MTAEGGCRGDSGRTIVVAVQMDVEGRDLLDWTICNAAESGDHVVAVHVCRKSDLHGQSPLSITKALDVYLSEFDGFCNARKVVLIGRLAQGSSIRKAVVKEAEICEADVVIVGANRNGSFRGPPSLFKYCARKLPPTVLLLAVQNGKIAYERKAAASPQASISTSGQSARLSLGSILYPSLNLKTERDLPSVPSTEKESGGRRTLLKALSFMDRTSKDDPESVGSSLNVRRRSESMRSLSLLAEKFPEKPSGWPLLQRGESLDSGAGSDYTARDVSVVQWVMNLPDRSQQSPQAQEDSRPPLSVFEPRDLQEYAELCRKVEAILEMSRGRHRWFSRSELEESTCQFSPENLIGSGGCSSVFRGRLPDGQEIAVKLTKLSKAALADFVTEAEIIATVQHCNIVDPIGVCISREEIISVYSFFPRGSLEENLHSKKAKQQPLSWNVRYKIALGLAEALNYLHTECPRSVIHRDVKSSNVLLSDHYEPQLSDFGLAVWAPNSSSSLIYSNVVGTFGYLAPEYFMYGKVSEKADVYSFGVVLLELLTGRKPICPESSKGEESLVMWVTKKLEQSDLMDLVDSSAESDCDKDRIRRMALAASISIRRVARLRPRMSQVVALLRGEETIEGWIETLSCSAAAAAEEDPEQDPEEEACTPSSLASHLGVAFQDIDDSTSSSSVEQIHGNLENYLRGRWSRSSSFN